MSAELQWDVYMSGALSALSEEDKNYVITQIYSRVDRICKSINLKCYLPHQSQTTPSRGMPHSKVWEIDYEHVIHSRAIVAYIGIPACGVGAEIEMARRENVPVILLFESTKRGNLPQLVLGSPQIKSVIAFDKPDEIDIKLRADLKQILSEAGSSSSNSENIPNSEHGKPTVEELEEKKVYISGTLSALLEENDKKITAVIKKVQQVCEQINVEYAPDKSQTTLNDNTPRQIWQELQRIIAGSGAVVADVSIPDCNVGAEIEMAHTANVPVVLLFERSKQEALSRLILGNPEIKHTIPFDKPDDVSKSLRTELILILSKRNLKETAYFDNWSYRTLCEKEAVLVEMEQKEQKGVKFSLPTEPISCKDWLNSARESDKSNDKDKKLKRNPSLDDFV